MKTNFDELLSTWIDSVFMGEGLIRRDNVYVDRKTGRAFEIAPFFFECLAEVNPEQEYDALESDFVKDLMLKNNGGRYVKAPRYDIAMEYQDMWDFAKSQPEELRYKLERALKWNSLFRDFMNVLDEAYFNWNDIQDGKRTAFLLDWAHEIGLDLCWNSDADVMQKEPLS